MKFSIFTIFAKFEIVSFGEFSIILKIKIFIIISGTEKKVLESVEDQKQAEKEVKANLLEARQNLNKVLEEIKTASSDAEAVATKAKQAAQAADKAKKKAAAARKEADEAIAAGQKALQEKAEAEQAADKARQEHLGLVEEVANKKQELHFLRTQIAELTQQKAVDFRQILAKEEQRKISVQNDIQAAVDLLNEKKNAVLEEEARAQKAKKAEADAFANKRKAENDAATAVLRILWTKFCPNFVILASLESWRRDLSGFRVNDLKFCVRVKDSKFGFWLGLRISKFEFIQNCGDKNCWAEEFH